MAVTPTGIISKRLDVLATMLAESTAFQTFVDAGDSSEAADSIYVTSPSASGAGELSRPMAVIWLAAGFSQDLNNFGKNTLKLLLEKDVAAENQASPKDAFYDFANEVGAIWADLDDARYDGGNLQVQTIRMATEIARANTREYIADSNTESDYFQVILDVEVGLR